MKLHKFFTCILLTALFIGCTTKSDTYYNRQFRMIPTMYNVLYNGNLALEEGKKELSEKLVENYFEILPVELEALSEGYQLKGEGNAHFDRAEEKAIKAIQRHSMVFDGKQKNRKIDDAYMLLGKARYYNGRYLPALEAFNHLLTNYGETNQRYNAAVWREKTHIQLGREQLAISSIEKLLEEEKPKRKERANLHAILAQAYINLKQYPQAIQALKLASVESRNKAQRGRYLFITGQLFEATAQRDSAQVYYQKTIDLNWNIPRRLWVEAQIGKARTQRLSPEEKIAYVEKLRKMEKLYEHKNLLDLVYFQHALYAEGENKDKEAIDYFLRSLAKNKENEGLKKRTHEHLGELYFKSKKYPLAYNHYDSTLVYIPKNTLEYLYMRRKRDNLSQITVFENTIAKADSLSHIMKMPQQERIAYFQKHIDSLQQPESKHTVAITDFGKVVRHQAQPSQDGFYFYSPQTVAYGKQGFKEQFGDRPLVDNWRWSHQLVVENIAENQKDSLSSKTITPEEYLSKLPSEEQMKQLERDKEMALYGVGELYWEKFKDEKLAKDRLTRLLAITHDDKLREKALYQLYKIHQQNHPAQAEAYKNQLLAAYPTSEYTKVVTGQVSTNEKQLQEQFSQLQQQFDNQQYQEVIAAIDAQKAAFKTSPQAPDWELLRAKALGRLEGKETYVRELEAIAKEYPNTKQADYVNESLEILKKEENKPDFDTDQKASSWKIVLEHFDNEVQKEQLKNYLEENGFAYISMSNDVYDANEQWTVLHGFMSREMAERFVEKINAFFQEKQQEKLPKGKKNKQEEKNEEKDRFFKEFFVISSENYAILQMYKNKEEYLKK